MAAAQVFLLGLLVVLATAAPQFDLDSSEEVTPYDFGYGVSDPETGDAKEHKESVSPNGRTEGEYRWLQPNGLFMIVRYYVDGDSGFQAVVSEEPGPDINNYYTNTMTHENTVGVPLPAASQSLAKSINTGPAVNAITQSRGFRTQQQSFGSQRQQSFGSQRQQSFGVPLESTSSQQNLGSQQQQSFGNVIDGGIIDGGIIDGGIIDGGIIDGGFIDGGFINDNFDDGSTTTFG